MATAVLGANLPGSVDLCLDGIQNTTYNKQLLLVLLDAAVRELFPETVEGTAT